MEQPTQVESDAKPDQLGPDQLGPDRGGPDRPGAEQGSGRSWCANTGRANTAGPGRPLRLIRHRDPAQAVELALAAQREGGVPLLGDDRWSAEHWLCLQRRLDGVAVHPQAQWATFTSGSTGAPRAVVRSHRSWQDSFDALDACARITGPQCWYLPLSLLSSMTTFTLAHARHRGDTYRFARHRAVAVEDLAQVTAAHLTPYALGRVVSCIEAGAASTLSTVIVGGARLDPGLRDRAAACGIHVVHYYGSAELSLVAIDTDGTGLRAFPGVELRLRPTESAGLSVLESRSPYAALQVLGRAGSWQSLDHGWHTVGDLVEEADFPVVRLRGRMDNAILTAGATVVPDEVEEAVLGLEGVAEAVAFGVPDARVGALVGVAVELEPGARLSIPHARAVLRERLPRSHQPRRWFVADRLPRTATDKPRRTDIAARALSGEWQTRG